MNEELEEKIAAAIKEDLPNKVGEELSKVLAQAKADAIAVADLRSTLDKNNKYIGELQTKLRSDMEAAQILADTKTNLKAIEIRENQLDMRLLEVKLESAELRAQDAVEFTAMVFKSPVYKKRYLSNELRDYEYSSDGNLISDKASPRTGEETTEE